MHDDRNMESQDAAYHYASMNKVFAFVDNHLRDDLSLNVLARVSGYSDSHFHRIFHALTGKTVHEYVNDRRVVASASRLLYDRGSMTRIASDCGFSSSSSFGRCFKKAMGCSPSYYRKHKERKRPLARTDEEEAVCRYVPDQALDACFSIASLPDLRVAGIAASGLSETFTSKTVDQAFKKLFSWLTRNQWMQENMPVMGITLDTPEVVSLAGCRYFACVPANAQMRTEAEIVVRTFPTSGKCITFTLDRTLHDFPKVFFGLTDYLYGCYMPMAG